MSSLDIALSYIAMGLSPIPIPYKEKRPHITEWQKLNINAENASEWFNCEPQNIGVQLGEKSGGLTDVDLDCPEAIAVAAAFLPKTHCFGRMSKRYSHWLFYTQLWKTETKATLQYKDGDVVLFEIRVGGFSGAQTIFPGSTHPNGEPITWENDGYAIAKCEDAQLKALCSTMAAATILARHYPAQGGRHAAALVIGGFLARCKFTKQDVACFIDSIAGATNQPRDKRQDMVRAACDCVEDFARGREMCGYPKLAETFTPRVAKKVADWLGYDQADGRTPFEDPRTDEPPPLGTEDLPPKVTGRRGAEIDPEPIVWAWTHWLARGKFHTIGGAPEAGKTTIGLSLIAIASSGGRWPDNTPAQPVNCLIWSSEDGVADTLVPRLMRMGANLNRVVFIETTKAENQKARPFNPATDMDGLAELAREVGGVGLIMLDPVVAVLPMTRNSHNAAETRNGMQPLVELARATDAAVIGVMHLAKGTAGHEPLERLSGSGAFGQLPRVVLFAAKNTADESEDAPERVMVRVKSNIGPSGGGFGYHIDTAALYERPDIIATRIVWEHAIEGTSKDILANAENMESDDNMSRMDIAKQFLRDFLAKGERAQPEVEEEAELHGIKERTLRRASHSKEGIVTKRKLGVGGWFWKLK